MSVALQAFCRRKRSSGWIYVISQSHKACRPVEGFIQFLSQPSVTPGCSGWPRTGASGCAFRLPQALHQRLPRRKVKMPPRFFLKLGSLSELLVALWLCLILAERPQQRGKAWSLLCRQAGTLGAGKGTGKGYSCACRSEIRADLSFTPN